MNLNPKNLDVYVRVVVSPLLPNSMRHKDRLLEYVNDRDPGNTLKYYPKTNKIVGNIKPSTFGKIKYYFNSRKLSLHIEKKQQNLV